MRWRTTFLVVVGSIFLQHAAALPPRPYFELDRAGTAFTDSVAPHLLPDTLREIRIGVLAPLSDPDGMAIVEGVKIAVSEANAAGGYGGIPFVVVPRTTEGPWGIAAKQVVALTYDDGVWAIIGGLTGQQTHLAELIAEKAWIPVITPWASDVTIDYANVPWVFRIAPDDRAQARLLLKYAHRRELDRLVIVTEGTREGYTAQTRLREIAREGRHPPAFVLEYDPHAPEGIAPRIMDGRPDGVVLWGKQTTAVRLIRALRRSGYGGPILAPSLLAAPEILAWADSLGELIVAAPYDLSRRTLERASFARAYRVMTGHAPRPSAVLAYDVARMVIASVRTVGLNRARIRRALAEGEFVGLSGRYAFNSLGGAEREPVLLTARGGRWHRVEGIGVTPAGRNVAP